MTKNMDVKILNSQKEYSIRILNIGDENIVQVLCEQCPDYFKIVKNEKPGKDAGHEILTDLPPGKNLSDKFVFGFFNADGKLIAVADVVRGWKDEDEWTIGLLLIHPAERGRGLGKTIHEFIKNFAKTNDAVKLRIGVVEQNIKAINFWTKQGYQKIERVKRKYGNNDSLVIIMGLSI
jgi:ribosomal protein S18 acetylase RimI-like enzyme